MVLIVLGGVFFLTATGLDLFFRIRLYRVGNRRAIVESATFDYRRYHQVRSEHGWASWPVYLMWTMYVAGFGFLIGGFAVHFGLPTRSP